MTDSLLDDVLGLLMVKDFKRRIHKLNFFMYLRYHRTVCLFITQFEMKCLSDSARASVPFCHKMK